MILSGQEAEFLLKIKCAANLKGALDETDNWGQETDYQDCSSGK